MREEIQRGVALRNVWGVPSFPDEGAALAWISTVCADTLIATLLADASNLYHALAAATLIPDAKVSCQLLDLVSASASSCPHDVSPLYALIQSIRFSVVQETLLQARVDIMEESATCH